MVQDNLHFLHRTVYLNFSSAVLSRTDGSLAKVSSANMYVVMDKIKKLVTRKQRDGQSHILNLRPGKKICKFFSFFFTLCNRLIEGWTVIS